MNAAVEIAGGARPFGGAVLPELADALRGAVDGELVAVETARDDVARDLERWAAITGHSLVAREAAPGGSRYLVRKGPAPAELEDEHALGARLWVYANFDCNLACDYCCVRSSPRAPPRALGAERVARLADEARALRVRRVLVTGGEPFLPEDAGDVIRAAAERLPTTVLTNAMLFRGPRLATLDALPRDRVTLQVSLDSPTPALHDAHRGTGSWARAREGIATARRLGFRVRVAATVATAADRDAMDAFLGADGVPPEDRVIRPIARRGAAAEGVALARRDLAPELTATAIGYYWHPVGAGDDDLMVTRELFPLAAAFGEARRLLAEDRAMADRISQVFVCA